MNAEIKLLDHEKTCRWTNSDNPEVNTCTCGSSAYIDFRNRNFFVRLLSHFQNRFTYFVVCSNKECNNSGYAHNSRALAILYWNISSNSQFPNRLELPLSQIEELDESEILSILIEEKSAILINQHQLKSGFFMRFFRHSKFYSELSLRLAWIEYGLAYMTEKSLQISSIKSSMSERVSIVS